MRQAKRANGAPLQSGAGVAPFLVRHRVQNELFLDIEPHPTRSARDIMAAPGDKFYDALLLAIRQAGAHGKPVTLKDVVGAKTRQQGPAWAKAAAADAVKKGAFYRRVAAPGSSTKGGVYHLEPPRVTSSGKICQYHRGGTLTYPPPSTSTRRRLRCAPTGTSSNSSPTHPNWGSRVTPPPKPGVSKHTLSKASLFIFY